MQQRQHGKKALKELLANSGYSENVTDKVWKWYNPPKKKE
jgi:hypothetical protein